MSARDGYWEHESNAQECKSPTCRVLEADGWDGVVKRAHQSKKSLHKESMAQFNKLSGDK